MLNFFKKSKKSNYDQQNFDRERIEKIVEEQQIKKGSFVEICFKDKNKSNVKAVCSDAIITYTPGKYGIEIFDLCRWSEDTIFCEDIESIIKRDEIAEEIKKKEYDVLDKIAGFRTNSGCFVSLLVKNSSSSSEDYWIEGDVRDIGQQIVNGAVLLGLNIYPLVEQYSMNPDDEIKRISPDYGNRYNIKLASIIEVMEPKTKNIVPTLSLSMNVGYKRFLEKK